MYHFLHSFLETWTPFWYFDASSSVSNILPVVSFREKSVLLQSTEKKPGHFVWPYRISQKIKAMLLFHMVSWVGAVHNKRLQFKGVGEASKFIEFCQRIEGSKCRHGGEGCQKNKKGQRLLWMVPWLVECLLCKSWWWAQISRRKNMKEIKKNHVHNSKTHCKQSLKPNNRECKWKVALACRLSNSWWPFLPD